LGPPERQLIVHPIDRAACQARFIRLNGLPEILISSVFRDAVSAALQVGVSGAEARAFQS
jgi:hypothetical protein